MRTISLRLDDATDAVLRRLAAQLSLTQTDVIKRALEHLAQRESPSPNALAEGLGLIGAFVGHAGSDTRSYSERVRARLQSKRARDERDAT
jgi:predicted transcriptional regulator